MLARAKSAPKVECPECPICMEILQVPIYSCTNGHAVCGECKQRITECPECRSELSFRNRALEQLVEKITLPCKYLENGCTRRDNHKEAIKKHHEVCNFRKIDCTLKGCDFKPVIFNRFHQHIEKRHADFIKAHSYGEVFEDSFHLRDGRGYFINIFNCSETSKEYFLANYYFDTPKNIFFIYVCYLGKTEDAVKYVYTFTVDQKVLGKQFTYSNFCLPYVTINRYDTYGRYYVLDPRKIFLKRLAPDDQVLVSVKIEPVKSSSKH